MVLYRQPPLQHAAHRVTAEVGFLYVAEIEPIEPGWWPRDVLLTRVDERGIISALTIVIISCMFLYVSRSQGTDSSYRSPAINGRLTE